MLWQRLKKWSPSLNHKSAVVTNCNRWRNITEPTKNLIRAVHDVPARHNHTACSLYSSGRYLNWAIKHVLRLQASHTSEWRWTRILWTGGCSQMWRHSTVVASHEVLKSPMTPMNFTTHSQRATTAARKSERVRFRAVAVSPWFREWLVWSGWIQFLASKFTAPELRSITLWRALCILKILMTWRPRLLQLSRKSRRRRWTSDEKIWLPLWIALWAWQQSSAFEENVCQVLSYKRQMFPFYNAIYKSANESSRMFPYRRVRWHYVEYIDTEISYSSKFRWKWMDVHPFGLASNFLWCHIINCTVIFTEHNFALKNNTFRCLSCRPLVLPCCILFVLQFSFYVFFTL